MLCVVTADNLFVVLQWCSDNSQMYGIYTYIYISIALEGGIADLYKQQSIQTLQDSQHMRKQILQYTVKSQLWQVSIFVLSRQH